MSLQRNEIRKAWTSLIKAARTAAGNKVYSSRINPVWQENLPAVNIYTENEGNGEILDESPLRMDRNMAIYIECMVEGRDEEEAGDNLDLLMDQIEQAILYELSYNEEFRCLHDEVLIGGIDTEFKENGKRVSASGSINWNVRYFTSVRNPKRLDDLATVEATFSVGPDSENEVDRFNVPTN